MWYSIKNYFRDLWTIVPTLGCVLVEVGMILYGFKNIKPTENGIFLRYTILVGPSLQGEWWKLYYLPIIGLVIFLFHFLFGLLLYKQYKIMARFISVCTLLLLICIGAAFFLLIGINY